jgi:hypothetical protein
MNLSHSLSISANLRFMLARPDMAPSLGGLVRPAF